MLFDCNYVKKAFSAVLLVLLLAIHSIKLLHSHPTNAFFLDHSCDAAALEINDNSETGNQPHCSICSYQLSKDADDLACVSDEPQATEHTIFSSHLPSSHRFSFHAAFENRGPPPII